MPQSPILDRRIVVQTYSYNAESSSQFLVSERPAWAAFHDLGTSERTESNNRGTFIVTYSLRQYIVRWDQEVWNNQVNNNFSYPIRIVDEGIMWRCTKVREMTEIGRKQYMELEALSGLYQAQ